MFPLREPKRLYSLLPGDLPTEEGADQPSTWPRISMQRISIVCNIVTLILVVMWFIIAEELHATPLDCELSSDMLWGRRIPYKLVTQQNEQVFIDNDPFNGNWNEDPYYNPPVDTFSPWDTLYEGSWVGLDTSILDDESLAFGTPLAAGPGYYEGATDDPIPWKVGEQAFGIAVMHQLHCVAGLKHAINDLRLPGRNGRWANSSVVIGHTDHCLEILRQAVLCHGDLTLQRPDNPNPDPRGYVGITGWGNQHLCRDWEVVREVIAEHSIVWKNGHGWMHKKIGTGYQGGFASHKLDSEGY